MFSLNKLNKIYEESSCDEKRSCVEVEKCSRKGVVVKSRVSETLNIAGDVSYYVRRIVRNLLGRNNISPVLEEHRNEQNDIDFYYTLPDCKYDVAVKETTLKQDMLLAIYGKIESFLPVSNCVVQQPVENFVYIQVGKVIYNKKVHLYTTIKDIEDWLNNEIENLPHFYLSFRNKPLRSCCTIGDYGIQTHDTIVINYSLGLGGGKITTYDDLIFTNYLVRECESQVLAGDQSEFELESFSSVFEVIQDKFIGADKDFVIKLLEDICVLAYQLINSRTYCDYTISIVNFVKLRSSGPIISQSNIENMMRYFEQIFPQNEVEIQSFEGSISSIRGYLECYERVKGTPIFRKMYKFLMYALSLSLFEKIGITFKTCRYKKVEEEAIRRKYYFGVDFIHTMIDTIIFLCERGLQCMQTGNMDPLFHSGTKYEEWCAKAFDLQRKSKLLTNPEPHGFTKPEFLADLSDAIDRGKAMFKYIDRKQNEFERRLVLKVLNDLQLIQNEELTKRNAQKERKAPFAVLLYGGSSVAKSTMTKILFYHYGKLFGLPTGSEFKYVRNPVDQYWTNFNTSQWCIQMDDIGFMHPNKAMNGDPSVMEMLQVNNNVPFVPTQAELADKGRTPVQARFLIATTNTEDLNAYAYFSCPLAVQRRLPYIIDIRPKEEYSKYGTMLDGELVPEIEEGEYPDYWNITVKRILPFGEERRHQKAVIEKVADYTNIYDFMQWFSQQALDYEVLQEKAMRCDDHMAKVELCNNCHLPMKVCRCQLEAYDEAMQEARNVYQDVDGSIWFMIKSFILYYIFWCYIRSPCKVKFVLKCLGFGPLWFMSLSLIHARDFRTYKMIFGFLGRRAHRTIGYYSTPVIIVTMLASSFLMIKSCSYLYSCFTNRNKTEMELNGSEISKNIGRAPASQGTERANVWYKDDYETTTFDVSPSNISYKALDINQVSEILYRNCVMFKFTRIINGECTTSKHTRGVCVQGHIYMFNTHAIPDCEQMFLEVISSPYKDGVNTNIKFLINKSEIKSLSEKDLSFIEIRNLPPKKNISELFCKNSLKGGFKGFYIGKNLDGSKFFQKIENIHKSFFSYDRDGYAIASEAWCGLTPEPTEKGDCGSLLIVTSAYGPIILGFHVAGGQNGVVYSLNIPQETIKEGVRMFNRIQIESGVPQLSSESQKMEILDLNKKSPIRYMQDGSASVYGSFSGFRQGGKSRVEPTLICASMLRRGYILNTGPPIMKGWEPWYIALNDMVRPVNKLNNLILKDCVDNFKKDIFNELTDFSDVFVYDDFTAINGAPGVSYVDKINRNTSAGNPWKKSKKFFMRAASPRGETLDPVEVDEEIMSRVDKCIEGYLEGRRYCPNFCAHLKDEATAIKKIKSKKTRVFTGAPFDWTIVVRKYLLSVIRLIQNNRFIFEAAPGTIAQSLEWEQIREYLVEFGDERLVAGDYGKFDKRMPSTIILAAFDIIIDICKSAGYTEDELRVVQGIAEDTAFPLVDFNGDLIEFFGSNPSGHPLTVIINSLANSLYMRYCYAVLSPEKSSRNFKRNVHLMTYGDDNCMGVNSSIDFFHHTSIKEVLAKVDIEYTMADKEAESIPFIHIDDVSFLKRIWKWDEDVGAYLCPLEHSSINKMLTMCVKSKTVTAEEQAIDVISTALREYFYYGKNVFLEKETMLREVVKENNLELYIKSSTFPSWDELKEQFWSSSAHISLKRNINH